MKRRRKSQCCIVGDFTLEDKVWLRRNIVHVHHWSKAETSVQVKTLHSPQFCKQQDWVFNMMVSVRNLSKCINMSAPGPHAILLVIKVGPFTAEEQNAVKKVEEIFGKDAWKYTIILFTHGDRVRSEFEKQLVEEGEKLQPVLKKVGHRYHVFNNNKINDRGQVLDLLEKVDDMVAANGGRFYSNYTNLQVVEMLDHREAELREFYQNKMKEEIKAVESKYEKKLSEAEQERQQVEKRLQAELEEVKRYYHALETGVRHVVEQTVATDSISKVLNKFHETQKLQLTS
uniref:AIG1-type G domain-containing protein n=1 Tax=Mastacembelus armatus TaxID=205130 RepID=A0A3Q3M7S7_9TELE